MFLSKRLNCLHEHILIRPIRSGRLKPPPFSASRPALYVASRSCFNQQVRLACSPKLAGNSPEIPPLRNNETSRSCRSPKNHKFRGQGSDTTSFVVTPPLTSTELQILSFPPALRGNERRAHLSGEHALVDKQRGSKAPKQPLKIFNPNVIEITTKVYS